MSTEKPTPTSQPSNISTEEEVRPADEHVVTDDRDFFGVASPADDKEKKPAASSDAKSPDQTTKPSAGSDDKEQKPRSKPGQDRPAERRIKDLTKQVAQLEGKSQQDQTKIDGLQSQIDDLVAKTPDVPEPQLKDFDSPAEYAEAFGKWKTAKQPAKKPDAATRKPTGERDPTKHATHDTGKPALDDEIVEFHTRGKTKLGDEFTEAIERKGTAVDDGMGEFLLDSDFGPEIYIHLANNQRDAKKIFDLRIGDKVKALEALEVKAKAGELDIDSMQQALDDADREDDLTGGKKEAKPTGNAVQTKAKEPPSDTREAGTADIKPDPENEDMDTYAARRNKEELKKRGIVV